MSPEEIVAGLSEAQRRAVCSLSDQWAPPSITRQTIAALVWRRPDLCEREWQDGCASMTYYRLTPLGQQVRTLLTQANSQPSQSPPKEPV